MNHHADEQGSVAIIVAVSLLAFIAVSALAIDLGSQLERRREVVSDVDGAALAAARYLADTPGCVTSWDWGSDAGQRAWGVIEANNTGSDQADFTIDFECASSTAGKVTVTGSREAITAFAPVLGVDELRAAGSATAQFGDFIAGEGVRPVGICSEADPYSHWSKSVDESEDYPDTVDYVSEEGYGALYPPEGVSYPADGRVYRVGFGDTDDTPCSDDGSAPGNWGWLDFGSGGQDVPGQIEDGYGETVYLTPECDPDGHSGEADCQSKTGALGDSVGKKLDDKICTSSTQDCLDSGLGMVFVVYGDATETAASGTNFEYDPVAFVAVVLWDYGKGATTGNSDDEWLDLEFVPGVDFAGEIGSGPSSESTIRGFSLCEVDRGPSTGCFF